MNKEFEEYLADCYTGFVCGVRPYYDHCHECEHFYVGSGWGEYCKASEEFAGLVINGWKKLKLPAGGGE